jgi:hypothetical protein
MLNSNSGKNEIYSWEGLGAQVNSFISDNTSSRESVGYSPSEVGADHGYYGRVMEIDFK